jgi:hypothetical protein
VTDQFAEYEIAPGGYVFELAPAVGGRGRDGG